MISSCKSAGVEALVAECARHRVDMDFVELRTSDGFILGNHTRVREQPRT